MGSYKSKYSGEEMDAILTLAKENNSGNTNIEIDSELSETSTNPVQNKVVALALKDKVSKEDGKDLSSNNFTDEEKSKLAEILLGTLNIKEKNSSLGGLTIVHDGIYGNETINIDLSGGELRGCTTANIEVLRFLDTTGNMVDLSSVISGLNDQLGNIEDQLGNIETALDNIIAIQTSLIGGES